MKTTITLTISVMSPQGTLLYQVVKPGILKSDAIHYISLLDGLGCLFQYSSGNSASLIIYQPPLIASEMTVHNSNYFGALGISESDKVQALHLPGDAKFWALFDDEQIVFVKLLFSSKDNAEIGALYSLGEKSIELKIKEILLIVKIKYPVQNPKNRKQLKALGIALGVHSEKRCKECNGIL